MVATLADRGLPIIGVLIVARMLGPEDFGAFGVAQNTANLAQVFLLAGMGTVAARFVASRRSDPAGVASVVSMLSRSLLATTLVAFLATMIFAEPASRAMYGSPDRASDVRLIALYFTVLSWNALQSALLIGFEAMQSLVYSSLVGGVLGLCGLVLGAVFGGVHGALWGLIIARGARCGMTSIMLSRRLTVSNFPWDAPVKAGDWALLSFFGAASFIQSAVYNTAAWLSQVSIVQLHPQGLEQLGVFQAANQFSSLMLLFQTILTRVLMPYISERSANGSASEVRSVVWSAATFAFLGTVGMAAVVSIFSPLIMATAGATYAKYWPLLLLLAGATCISSVVAVLEAFMFGSGKAWGVVAGTIPGMAAMLAVVVAFSSRGAYALGWGMAIALIIRLLILAASTARELSRHTQPPTA